MSNIFLISDTHFFHTNILKVRPQFTNITEMNNHIVDCWNKTVNPTDTIYHLGDVAMWKVSNLEICKQLNGNKILIRGNHDTFHESVYYSNGFSKVLSMKEWSAQGGMVCTHIPIHPQEMYRWRVNVHGHIHNQRVQQPVVETVTVSDDQGRAWDGAVMVGIEDDPRYICVSVEQTNYFPVSLDSLRQRVNGGLIK